MNNRITDELQSFMKDYAAEPTPRDSAIAKHFYNLALEDVKKWVGERADDNLYLWSVSDRGDAHIAKRDAFLSARRYINSLKSK